MKRLLKIVGICIVVCGLGLGGALLFSNANRGEFITQESGIHFRTIKFGFIEVLGEFREFHAQGIVQNGKVIELKGTIEAASVDSKNEARDEKIRAQELLNVAQNPVISFEMIEFAPSQNSDDKDSDDIGTGTIVGNLTLNGITKQVVLKSHIKPENALSLRTRINVKDFGMPNFPVVSDEVEISANIALEE